MFFECLRENVRLKSTVFTKLTIDSGKKTTIFYAKIAFIN